MPQSSKYRQIIPGGLVPAMDKDKQRSHINHFFLHLFFCQVKQLTTAAMSAATFSQQRKHETAIQFFHRIRKKLQPLAKGSQELLFLIT